MFIFFDLVDLDLTYFGWCFKIVPFLTGYDHQGAHTLSKMFDLGRSPKVGQMRVKKKYLKNKLGPLSFQLDFSGLKSTTENQWKSNVGKP